ncbi:hypothetical protein AAE478_003587 [Parahypoxylon ruwenzoriense]
MTSANTDTELLTEHFGYPPVSLIDDIINSINILAERALNSVEQGLLNAPPASLGFKQPSSSSSNSRKAKQNAQEQQQQQLPPAEAAKTEIESGTHQLETLLCASIDRNFDKFEIYVLRNILCVRPVDIRRWMRLSHYDGLDFTSFIISPDSAAAGAPSLDTINHLRRKLRESMRLNALLTAERARNEKLLSELKALVGLPAETQVKPEKTSPSAQAPQSQPPQQAQAQQLDSPFAFLHRKGDLTDGGPEAPLSTTTAFTLSQMQALRALSISLRNLAPDLLPAAAPGPSSPSSMDVDNDESSSSKDNNNKKKSWRRERLEYVEGATRRYLENVEGLELGRHGEVRDGEWQGEGRSLGTGEVEGLESAVAIMGAGGDSAAAGTTTAGIITTAGVGAGAAAEAEAGTTSRDDDRMDES